MQLDPNCPYVWVDIIVDAEQRATINTLLRDTGIEGLDGNTFGVPLIPEEWTPEDGDPTHYIATGPIHRDALQFLPQHEAPQPEAPPAP